MNEKVFRNYVISANDGSWYVTLNDDSEIELTGDLLNAHFFYDKQACIDFANEKCADIQVRSLEVVQLFMKVDIFSKTSIR